MSHEFKIHHNVSELMTLMNVKSSPGPGAEVYAEMLQRNVTPYVTTQLLTQNAKRRIAELSPTPNEFLEKYDELKSKNVRDLDPLVYLISKLSDSKPMLKFLRRNHEGRLGRGSTVVGADSFQSLSSIGNLPPSGTKMTAEELETIKAQLMLASSDASAYINTDILNKISREKHSSKNENIPAQPEWLQSRPYLTMDFVLERDATDSEFGTVGALPLQLQESALIEDLLCCAEGVEGKYIQVMPLLDGHAHRDFKVDPSLDSSLRDLVKRILPLCSDYSLIVRFIEEKSAFEFGLVNHALAAAMRTLIKDYMVLVAQLENQQRLGELTLQKFWFYIQPTMFMTEVLVSVATSINRGELVGGAVLSLLHEKTSNLIGNTEGQELCIYLIQSACVPYFEILEKWIYKGLICDPYSEFLVEQNDAFQKEKLQEDYNDAYWEQHYTIRDERIPIFLERVADKILNTGKYLNVVWQCGRSVQCPHAKEIVYTIKERQYFEHIEKGYDYASKLLLELLMDEKQLMARLRSIKHYFLLDQGDFIVQFMDMAEDEMKKPMNEIMLPRLETLLELALRTSTANEDPFKDDLKVELLSYDLITQLFKILTIETKQEKAYRVDPTDLRLSGLEAFAFDYVVKWPVSLVVSRKSLIKYQMLFRHLFYCKHVERQICNVWLSNKSSKLFPLKATKYFALAFALRQRMLNFVQNYEYYMMFEVIEPNWLLFESNMEAVSNIDDVLAYHTDFLTVCLNDCMLTKPDLLRIVHKLMVVCITFSNFMQSQTADVESRSNPGSAAASSNPTDLSADREAKKAAEKLKLEHVDHVAGSEDFHSSIANFDKNFSHLLIELLDSITDVSTTNSEHKLLNILYRLDFNNFYTEQLEMMTAARKLLAKSISSEDQSVSRARHKKSFRPTSSMSSATGASLDVSNRKSSRSPNRGQRSPSRGLRSASVERAAVNE